MVPAAVAVAALNAALTDVIQQGGGSTQTMVELKEKLMKQT